MHSIVQKKYLNRHEKIRWLFWQTWEWLSFKQFPTTTYSDPASRLCLRVAAISSVIQQNQLLLHLEISLEGTGLLFQYKNNILPTSEVHKKRSDVPSNETNSIFFILPSYAKKHKVEIKDDIF